MKLSPNAARRVGDATRRVEKTPRTRVKPPGPARISPTAKYALVAGDIPGGSSTGPGKGTGTLQLVSYADDDSATYQSMFVTVPIYHGGTDPILSGRRVIVDLVDGRYHVVVDYC